jgi:hypothetical protein
MLARWFSGKKSPRKKPTYQPKLDALEARYALSVSSAAIHAVGDAFGDSSVFYLDKYYDNALFEVDHNKNTIYGLTSTDPTTQGPHTAVQAFSAGLDGTGHADVFVKAADSSFWEFSHALGWRQILPAGTLNTVQSFAAVKGGRLYAQFTDNTLKEFDGANWLTVPGSGTIQALDAVTDNYSCDAVFVKNTDGTFGEFYHGSYQQLAGLSYFGFGTIGTISTGNLARIGTGTSGTIGTGTNMIFSRSSYYRPIYSVPQVSTFSAGIGLNGQADVYALFFTGELKKNVGGLWTTVAAAGTVNQFSATDQEQVWVVASDNTLKKYDAAGVRHDIPHWVGETITSLSAARSDDVYMVDNHQILFERNAGAWTMWSPFWAVAQ